MPAEKPNENSSTSLTERASSGFLWLFIPNLVAKASGFIGQLILARLLAPRDFGLVALAYSIAALPKLLRDNGLLQVLIGKQEKIDRWVSAVFWFDLTAGILATVALAVAAPFCAIYFHQPQLTGLIWLVASGILINALTSVPMARLYYQLDFRKIALAGLQYNLGVLVTTVALAFLGFGAYSLLIPLPLLSAIRLIQYWRWAPSHIRWRLGLMRWGAIAKDAFPLAAGVFIFSLIAALPSIALGRIRTVAAAGIFYFGWNLSTQTLQLLSFNLMQVLLPVLTGLKDDLPRQAAAFLRVLRLVVFFTTPACAVVAVLAKPAVIMIFGPKWAVSAQVLAILSVGTPFALIGNPLVSYLQARHRYSFALYMALGMLAMAIPLTIAGAWLQGVILVAVGVVLQSVIGIPIVLYLSIRDSAAGWREVVSVFVPALPLGALAVLPIYALDSLCPELAKHNAANVLAGCAVAAIIYFGLAPLVCPAESGELWRRAVDLAGRIFKRR